MRGISAGSSTSGSSSESEDVVETNEPVRRASEIEEITNLYVIHPVSTFLTPRFARLGITPNAVSVAGMGFGVLAAFAWDLLGLDRRI